MNQYVCSIRYQERRYYPLVWLRAISMVRKRSELTLDNGASVASDIIGLGRSKNIAHFTPEKHFLKGSETTFKMPGEVIDRPNPKSLASDVPDSVLSLSVNLDKLRISENDIQALQDFRRASNYIAAGK
jgi:hypothetical protein